MRGDGLGDNGIAEKLKAEVAVVRDCGGFALARPAVDFVTRHSAREVSGTSRIDAAPGEFLR
jgi:hypothetical protein